MKRRSVVLAMPLLAAMLPLAGWTAVAQAQGSSTGGGGGTLTLGLTLPATTFVAADMAFDNESPYGQAVYDSLLKADPVGTILPSLATQWSYNADKTVLTLTLRSDVKFTDGTPFNADVAVQNLKRFQSGSSPNKSFLASLADAKAIDDTHLQITLKGADPAFLTYLSQNAGYQASPAAFGKPDAKTTPVGSGPYMIDAASTVIGSSYVFDKNPNYWDRANQPYDKLVLKVFNDPTAMLNAVKGKQLNGARLINNDFIEQVKGANYDLVAWEPNWTGLLLLDREGKMSPALKDVRVRQAINYAFDKQALIKAYGKGYGTPTTQIFPPKSVAFDAALDSKYDYNPTKAKQLLAEAGYANGFTLTMPTTASVGRTLYSLIGQQLKDVGITAQFTDAGTNFLSDILAPKYPVTWLALKQDPTDWQVVNYELSPTASWNPFKTTDPKVTELIAKYHDAKSDNDATAAIKELNAYIVDQAWFAPWYRQKSHYATDPKTEVKPQVGSPYPYLWNFKPKA